MLILQKSKTLSKSADALKNACTTVFLNKLYNYLLMNTNSHYICANEVISGCNFDCLFCLNSSDCSFSIKESANNELFRLR